MKAVAAIDHEGVPIDHDLLARLQAHWQQIRLRLIDAQNTEVANCYITGRLNKQRFGALLEQLGLLRTWPRTPTGQLSLDDDTLRERRGLHPLLDAFHELQATMSKFKTLDLPVGADGRHRAKAWFPLGAKTGRNAPSGLIFMPAVWARFMVKPARGQCTVYTDYSAEEVHIGARLSGDPEMIRAVESGDPYLHHAKATGLAPPEATKATHGAIRNEVYKPSLLSQFYGSGAWGLASRLGVSRDYAELELIRPHRELYRTYWRWSRDVTYSAADAGTIRTRFGWQMHITAKTSPRTLLNWPI